MAVCLVCGAHIMGDDRFCHDCGAGLHECSNCGFVNRVGDRYCASCGEYLEPQSPEPELSDDEPVTPPSTPRPSAPPALGAAVVAWAIASAVLTLCAAFAAFLGVGSPARSGDLPSGALTVAGIDPTSGTPVPIDLSKPIRVEGVVPSEAHGADTVTLAVSAADIELGSSSLPIVVQSNGTFVADFRPASNGRYLIAADTTGEVSLDEGPDTRVHQYFEAQIEHRTRLTIPLVVTVIGLYSLFWRITSLLRSLRRGRQRRLGPIRLLLLGGLGGILLVLIAWITNVREPTLGSVVLSAVFGGAAGLSAGLSAVAFGDRRRRRGRFGEPGNSPPKSTNGHTGAGATPAPSNK